MTAVSKPKRRTKAQQREEMLGQILDAAEYLFSLNGYHGVTIKDVAKQAETHTSLVHYYFTDKKALLDAVFERRAKISSGSRTAALDAYEQSCGDRPTVEGALRAYLDTDLDIYINGGEGWRNYATVGAQLAVTRWGAEYFDAHFDPVVLRLINLLKRALPDCEEGKIFWGYHFVMGGLIMTLARTGRLDILSAGAAKSEDFVSAKAYMARFMAGGLISLCRGIDPAA